eukprot:SAG22_NODE_706_length_7763_cov_4.404228_10_plen_226_part_00
MPTSAPAEFDYRRGTIVSIEVWNFVTYEHAAVYPNSRLNLVIGPNGSGKSSIVCAMCLGLGGSPKLLERGDAAKDYIRHGATEALIQIKLATGKAKEVQLVERKIIKIVDEEDLSEKGTDKWAIDGQLSSQKKAKELVRGYNIQLDNYTQFLPQDVVKMFPALTPVQLLERTQGALGDQVEAGSDKVGCQALPLCCAPTRVVSKPVPFLAVCLSFTRRCSSCTAS